MIPKAVEDELFDKMDGFIAANGCFGKIAQRAVEAGVPLTQEPALSEMFERKYMNPEAYWREYESWWAKWREEDEYKDIESAKPNPSFYSK